MSNGLKLARKLSKTVHKGQRYGTADYFKAHVNLIVESLKLHGFCDKFLIVAYLHDSIEDTHLTLQTVENLFGQEIAEAVDCISKRKEETEDQYLLRCSSNKLSRIVKLHDSLCNATSCFKNKNEVKLESYLNKISKLKKVKK